MKAFRNNSQRNPISIAFDDGERQITNEQARCLRQELTAAIADKVFVFVFDQAEPDEVRSVQHLSTQSEADAYESAVADHGLEMVALCWPFGADMLQERVPTCDITVIWPRVLEWCASRDIPVEADE